MFLARSRRTEDLPVGVHVGAAELRLIRLRVNRGPHDGAATKPFTVVASHRVPLTGPAGTAGDGSPESGAIAAASAIRASLRAMLANSRFTVPDITVSLPAALVHARTFRIGPVPPAEREALVQRQAREGTPFTGAGPVHAHVTAVGEARQGRDVRDEYLSVAAREADVRAFLEAAGTGVVVRSLQAEPFAVYRSVAGTAVCAQRDETRAVVHVGESETLVLIGTGPRLRVLRRIDAGAAHLDRAVAHRLGISPPEARPLRRRPRANATTTGEGADPVRAAIDDATRPAMEEMAREAAMCIRYHAVSFRSPLPLHVRLLGRDAADAQLRSLLGSSTGLPVDPRGVLDGLPGWAGDDDGGWSAAMGLALAFAPSLPALSRPPASPTVDETRTAQAAGEVAHV